MKIIFDFIPLLLFFAASKWYDIYVGTAVLMASTVIQMAVIYAMERKLDMQYKVTFALIMAFGSLTIALHDENFIKWKPTVLYAGFALGFAFTHWVLRKNVLRMLMGHQIQLPEVVWSRLVLIWIGYNAFMSAINAYVVLNYSTDDWVNFKLWGYIFPIAFILGQGLYIAPHVTMKETQDAEPKA
jgi:intracellular septation protein